MGAKVKVFYSPTDSADSVLEPGVHPSSWFLPLFGCAFIVFPIIMVGVGVLFGKRMVKSRTVADTNGIIGNNFT